MGIEHFVKDEEKTTARCPKCEHISALKVGTEDPYVSIYAGPTGPYFVCQNPKCNVERIYGANAIMVSGK